MEHPLAIPKRRRCGAKEGAPRTLPRNQVDLLPVPLSKKPGEELPRELYDTLAEKVRELVGKFDDEVQSLKGHLETWVSREKY
ncbi:MAG: hypothetical protein KIH10_16965 [Candidatus Freyarchaeota archaeon]|nr:hypothetical protein [Candidatus Jordarchaeia archaeon]